MIRALKSIFLMAAVASAVHGQNVSCMLNGAVRDSSGAAAPSAIITISNQATAAVRTVKSGADGYFVFTDLLPGTYSLRIVMQGFKTYQQNDIRLHAGDLRALGQIVLAVGALTEVIDVRADSAPVDLSSGEKSGVISGEELGRLAIRGRDFLDVLRLLPGVVDTNESREAPGPDGIRSIFINGGREDQRNMTVDGVTNLDTGSNLTTHTSPSVETIAQVKLLASNYQAEFGRNSGGTIIVITKGGGRQYHGSAWWYHRHEQFNANDFFNNVKGVTRPPYRYNIAGWSLGGPLLPTRQQRRNPRLFFFFSEEFQEQKINYGTRTVRVPTALERAGDFSQTFDVNGRLVTVKDPLSGKQFPNNVIPVNRLSVLGRGVLNMFPMPNYVDPAPSRVYQWNYITSRSGSYPRHQQMVRVDFTPSPWQAYFRYTRDADEQHPPYGSWVNGSVNYDLATLTYRQPGRGATLNVTRSLGTTLVNEFIFGYSMNRLSFYPDDPSRITRSGRQLPLPQWRPELNPEGFLPNMTFGGVSNYANPSIDNRLPHRNVNHIFSFVENLSKSHGPHTLKMGAYVERTRKDAFVAVPIRGALAFDNDANNPLNANHAYANAVLGVFNSYTEATSRPYALYRFTNLEWYAQDNWRVGRRLTLDFGLRLYHDPAQAEIRGQASAFVPQLYDPARAPVLISPVRIGSTRVGIDPLSGTIYPAGLIGVYVPGVGNQAAGMVQGGTSGFPKSLYSVPPLSLGPRFGFAYDPIGRGRTAVRGGFGVFYNRIAANPLVLTVSNPPTVFTPTMYYSTLEDLAASAGSGLLAPSATISSLYGSGRMPSTFNYSFGIQQAIGRDVRLDVSYVGSVSRHLLWRRNINAVPIGARFLAENRDPTTNAAYPPNFLRPYRGYGDIYLFEFAGTANYNSLQVSFQGQLRRALQLRASYTLAKTLGTAACDTCGVSPFFDPRQWNYGRLPFDRDQVLTLHYNWPVPLLRFAQQQPWLRAIVSNWQLSGVTTISAGAPFTPGYSLTDSVDITGTPSESARIVALGTNQFGRPAPRTFGNAGVNILRGPGINNWDMRASRRFPLGSERRTLEFRAEFYNLANHTQFSTLDTTARFNPAGEQINPLFLTPISSRPPRRIQFALKLNW